MDTHLEQQEHPWADFLAPEDIPPPRQPSLTAEDKVKLARLLVRNPDFDLRLRQRFSKARAESRWKRLPINNYYGLRLDIPGDCPALTILLAYDQKQLGRSEREDLKLHLNRCPKCGYRLHKLRLARTDPVVQQEMCDRSATNGQATFRPPKT